MLFRRLINKRQFAFILTVFLAGLSVSILLARNIYYAAHDEVQAKFQTASALYLDRIRSELAEGFVAADDFQKYLLVSPQMNEAGVSQFVEAYSALRKNRSLIALMLSATGENERQKKFEILQILGGGEQFTSWTLDKVQNRNLKQDEEAFYISFHWQGDVKGDDPLVDLTGAEVGQYSDVVSLIKATRATGLTQATIFSGESDDIADHLGHFLIASPFKVEASIEFFLLQAVDMGALIRSIEPVTDDFVEYISLTRAEDDESAITGVSGKLIMDATNLEERDTIDISDYWVFEKDEILGASTWRFAAYANPNSFPMTYDAIFMVLLTGVGFTCLLCSVLLQQMQRSNRVAEIVDRRTRALTEAHSELENHYRMLQNLNHEVDDARRAAEMANMAKSEFLATMSHELRTPLNAILGFSQLIEEETLGPIGDDRYKDYAGDIHSSGEHLLSIINDILDLAKLEAGKVTIERTPIEVAALGKHVVSLLQHQAQEKNIRLDYEVAADMPVFVMGDELRLRQILINLASNSIKFTQKGSVIIRFIPKAFKNGRAGWVLEVQDTGIGIPEEKQMLLFDRFTQVDTALSRRHGGVGLGLAICRELVDRMEGMISVRSMQNVGTTVRAHLPLDVAEQTDEDSPFI